MELAAPCLMVLIIVLGMLVWLPTTRWLIGPLLTAAESSDRATTYYAVDFLPLLIQLSVVGMLTSYVVNSPVQHVAAVVLLVLIIFEAFGSWWLAVRCLTLGGVTGLWRRFLFQLLVVPTSVLLPIVMVAIPTLVCVPVAARSSDPRVLLVAFLIGVALDVVLLVVVYFVSRWVLAGGRSGAPDCGYCVRTDAARTASAARGRSA